MKELKAQMKAGAFKPCYLFYGEEEYLLKKYETDFKACFLQEGQEAMNFELFAEKKAPVDAMIAAAKTPPFLAERKLIYVKNSGLFQTGRKEDSEKMALYCKEIPETSCIVFLEEEIDKRGKLYKAVVKNGHVVEFKTLDEKTLILWVTKVLKEQKIQIERAVAAYFLRTVGNNMETIEKELEKLAGLLGAGGTVREEQIDAICVKTLETKIFDLVGAMGNKQAEKAVGIYRNMLFMKESPLMILSMIIRQFRLILECKALIEEGKLTRTADMAARLSLREFIVRECLKQGANFSLAECKKAMESCLTLDVQIKTGGIAADLGVELLLLEFAKGNPA